MILDNLIGRVSIPLSSALAFVPDTILSFGGKILLAAIFGIITITAQEIWKQKVLSKILNKDKK